MSELVNPSIRVRSASPSPVEHRRARDVAHVPAVPEQEQGEEQENAAVGRRGRGQHRRERDDRQPGHHDPDAPETVRQPPGDRRQREHAERVATDDQPDRRQPWPCSVMWSGVIVMISVITTWTVTSEAIATGTLGWARILSIDVAVRRCRAVAVGVSASVYGSGRSIMNDRIAAAADEDDRQQVGAGVRRQAELTPSSPAGRRGSGR